VQVRRPDGTIQPDSRKRVVSFERQRDGIAYSVVPQTRWNIPEQSDAPDSVIYALPGSTLYLQAFKAGEYNAYEYAHMLDPQDSAAQPDRNTWISFDPTTRPEMQVSSGGQPIAELASQPFVVRQLSGGGLGYEVAPFDPTRAERKTFDGYSLNLDASGAEYAVQLLDENGTPIPGSQRRILTLNTDRVWWPYILSALPLVVGVGVLVWRRSQARKITVDQ
jgi:hypothetical protein